MDEKQFAELLNSYTLSLAVQNDVFITRLLAMKVPPMIVRDLSITAITQTLAYIYRRSNVQPEVGTPILRAAIKTAGDDIWFEKLKIAVDAVLAEVDAKENGTHGVLHGEKPN